MGKANKEMSAEYDFRGKKIRAESNPQASARCGFCPKNTARRRRISTKRCRNESLCKSDSKSSDVRECRKRLFLFPRRTSRKSGPDYQKLAEIFIQILQIYAVMNAVMRRSCKNQLNRSPQFRDKFRVMQKRDEQVNPAHHIDM